MDVSSIESTSGCVYILSEPSILRTSSPETPNRPKTYNRISCDRKHVLVKCYKEGKSIKEAAEIAGINTSTAKGIINRYNKNCSMLIEKKRGGKRNVKLNPEILDEIKKIVEEYPSITLKRIREKILERKQAEISITSIVNGLKKLQITLRCASIHRPQLAKC